MAPQVLSLPTSGTYQRWNENCSEPLGRSHTPTRRNTRQHRQDQPRRAQVAQLTPKAMLRWQSTPKPRRRTHRPKTRKHRQTHPSNATLASPHHEPAHSGSPRRRSHPPAAPLPHQSAAPTQPRRTQPSRPTQPSAHTNPPESPQPHKGRRDRQTRRHQYAPHPPSGTTPRRAGPRAPARQMVVRITLCTCLEGREGTGNQPIPMVAHTGGRVPVCVACTLLGCLWV